MAQQPPPPKPMPKDFEDLDFTILSEEWNEYELKDGATIRARIVLTRIARDPYDPKNLGFEFSNPVWVVRAPVSLRGDPDPTQHGQPLSGSKYEVHVDRNHEPWNAYRIIKTGQKLKIKLTVNEVSRYVNKFDAKGMPLYNVPTGVAVNLSEPDPNEGQ
ncbi:MAG: hypothetical protein KGI11_09225 [Thaumarchaeota archaeon]|nr:hypothetical protein [Nitrososphaerota archaeon]